MKFFKATSQPIFARKPCQKHYISYVLSLVSIGKRTLLLDIEGFYLLGVANATPATASPALRYSITNVNASGSSTMLYELSMSAVCVYRK